MDAALIFAAFFIAGSTFGYPIGKIVAAKKMRPRLRQMSRRILYLEEEIVDLITSKDEVATLERWMRN